MVKQTFCKSNIYLAKHQCLCRFSCRFNKNPTHRCKICSKMFSISVKMQDCSKKKGKSNQNDVVKLELVFYKTGYPRVPKVMNISGIRKNWDESKQQFKERDFDDASKNRIILEEKMRYQKIAEQWDSEGINWSPKMLSHCFDIEIEAKESETKVKSVVQMIDELELKFNNNKRIKNGMIISSANNARNYTFLKNSLCRFTNKKYNRSFSSYFFHNIDNLFLQDYVDFIITESKKKGNNGGLSHKLKLLKAVFNVAKNEGMYGVNLKIFDCVEIYIKRTIPEPKTTSCEIIAQIEQIDRKIFTKCENLHIDLFLFSYYTGGMCNIDACLLTNKSIKDDMLIYERIKINKKARPLLTTKSKAIIDKYKKQCYGDFVLPVFNSKHNTENKMYIRVKYMTIKVNKTLRKVCKELKIKDRITWNSSRGTFISKMIDAGYHPVVVAEQAGNSPEVIYKHYYKNTNQKSMLKNMNEIL